MWIAFKGETHGNIIGINKEYYFDDLDFKYINTRHRYRRAY